MMRVAHMKNITGVDVMIKRLLYEILWFVTRQLSNPESKKCVISDCCNLNLYINVLCADFRVLNMYTFLFYTYLASRKMSLRSRLALNMNMLL